MDIGQAAALKLIRGLHRGTITPGGSKYIHCGHDRWLAAQVEELAELEIDSGAAVHFVRGAYGEGKTHFLNYLEDIATDRGWVSAHLECRKDAVELDRFETVYPRIMQKLRLVVEPEGDGTESDQYPVYRMMHHWTDIVLKAAGYVKAPVIKIFEVETRIFENLQKEVMSLNLPGDFQRVVCAFPRAVLNKDFSAQNDLISWLNGGSSVIHIPAYLLSKPGQRVQAPGIDPRLVKAVEVRPITAGTSLDVFHAILWMLRKLGYKGLVLSIDEVEYIARVKPEKRKESCLQTLREFVDNTVGDSGLRRVSIYFAATPNMFDDKRYFPSYDALATRIEPVSEEINWRAPVINLERTPLTADQLRNVALKIKYVFERAYGSGATKDISEDHLSELVNTISKSKYRIAKPRLLCKTVVDYLDRARQNLQSEDVGQLVSRTAATLIKESEN